MSKSVDTRVSKRYAGALFNAASKLSKIDAVAADLVTLAGLWKSTPNLASTMESPLIPADRKKSVVDMMFSKDLDALTVGFVKLLIDKSRENILASVGTEYQRLADAAQGLVRASAMVASPLDDAQKASLIAGLEKRTGKKIQLTVEINPSILGGVVVRLQDTIIDGSVRGSLERLREQMLQSA